ncbi:uncharacterized protein EI90DRAFT_3130294 [Cantharellus anzutake]|uniref:uncharacterized protein n=1 Tax=Cantharellus anzutake TaxID=1750568 RepID=UPI0019054F29|nr:uncharacterized protein EI90DRAFT_3130294 [Cantharellus anzutake]KAF8323634.1 hypothetical protein EI90DRAFT_3130294 [Cantharellus anzutake]
MFRLIFPAFIVALFVAQGFANPVAPLPVEVERRNDTTPATGPYNPLADPTILSPEPPITDVHMTITNARIISVARRILTAGRAIVSPTDAIIADMVTANLAIVATRANIASPLTRTRVVHTTSATKDKNAATKRRGPAARLDIYATDTDAFRKVATHAAINIIAALDTSAAKAGKHVAATKNVRGIPSRWIDVRSDLVELSWNWCRPIRSWTLTLDCASD